MHSGPFGTSANATPSFVAPTWYTFVTATVVPAGRVSAPLPGAHQHVERLEGLFRGEFLRGVLCRHCGCAVFRGIVCNGSTRGGQQDGSEHARPSADSTAITE